MDLYNYVIFHRGCLDGFSGFFILNQTGKIHKNALIYPDIPSAKDIPPNIENKNIIIIDVAYNPDILMKIMQVAKKVTFIDHHISIREDILKLKIDKKHEIIYDDKKSGASLVWKYFYKNKKEPLFIKYIEDNDIGAWKIKETKPFILGLRVKYSTDLSRENLKRWKKLLNISEVKKLIKKGLVYQEYHNNLLDIETKRYSMLKFPSQKIYDEFPKFFTKVGQYRVAVYNGGGCPNASSLGERIMQKVDCDFALLWNYQFDKKEYILTMRSGDNKGKIVDVSQIAKLFGGGGHVQAASCSINKNKYEIFDLFTNEILPRSNK
jgi:oligoribonuclease NrnB/cAMP/cGMP phosphodiesterase (DHH superfamily)